MALRADERLTASRSGTRVHTWLANLMLLAGVPVLVGSGPAFAEPGGVAPDDLGLPLQPFGAWHLQHGHVPHVDFHEPVGQLNFVLTQLGFQLIGPTPFAFLIVSRSWRPPSSSPPCSRRCIGCRSCPPPCRDLRQPARADAAGAVICRTHTPRHVLQSLRLESAQHPCAYLVPAPKDRADGDWIDIANVGLMLTALFYLKVTYFAGGLALAALPY